jgi:hypothetical protein
MSARRRSPPSQKALALPDWPKADRETWQTAQETAGALDDGGAASHLNALARQDLTRRYAYFLSFLAHQGKLDLQGPAAATVTEQNILHYLRYLEPHVSSVTLAQSIYKIARVAHYLASGRDWRWLRRIVRRLELRAKPRDKRNDVVPIKELFQLGLKLMDQAENTAEATTSFRTLLYRDGLIIALLAADPLRLANITALARPGASISSRRRQRPVACISPSCWTGARFLAYQGTLDLQGPAAATVTDANILHYLRYLEPHVSSVTLAQSLYKIARVAHCLAPGRDWRWLRRLRLANITALELGRTLIKDGTTWSFNIPPEETKAGRLHLAVLPDWSASRIDRYVEHYRLFFRNAESTNRLWLSQLGRPLAYSSLYGLICKRTRDAFGKRINPHPFRSCLATSTAIYHGAEIGLAMTVLEHTSSEVFERYYNQAKMIDAVKAYQEILLANPQG